ncbi:MAG: hypothetical protein ACJAS9_002754 [Polaribacter sp.]|jgi:hypothetical protein
MPRKLRNILKQNRRLEEKIFYESRSSDWRENLISPKELNMALSCLANRIIENRTAELSVLTMLNEIPEITKRPIAAYEKNALQVVEMLFNYLRISTQFDPRFYHILNSLQLAFTRLALDDLSFLDNHKHHAVLFLEKLVNIGYHFDQGAGKLANYFVHAIEFLTDRLASKELVNIKVFASANRKLDDYITGFEEKASINTNKVLAKIDKSSRQIEADQFTSQLIKSKIEGDEIPIFLLDFFEKQLSIALHKIILESGNQSKQCQLLLTDMDTILWSLTCPYGDSNYNKRFEADVPDTMRRIYNLFTDNGDANEYVNSFFLEAEELHRKKLDGKRVRLDVIISADIFSDEEYEKDNFLTWQQTDDKELSCFDIENLEENGWYFLNIDGNKSRSKLFMINRLTEKLYFSNLSGELVTTIEFADKTKLLNTLTPTLLNVEIRYSHAIRSVTRELTTKLKTLELEYTQFKQQEIINKKQQQQAEERARFAVMRRMAKHRQDDQDKEDKKRQVEELAIATQRAEHQKLIDAKQIESNKIVELEQVEAKRCFKLKGDIKSLGTGTSVAVLKTPDRWVEASLMLISRTTQRYIFTDSSGNKVVEPTKKELVELLKGEKIRILKTNSPKADPMQKLVIERRKKLALKL